MTLVTNVEALVDLIEATPREHHRKIIALAGPPASGKSTLAERLVEKFNTGAQVVPMDGFHLSNEILASRGHLARKGAPHTFDADGFISLVSRLRNEPEVYYPVFDRSIETAIAGAGFVSKSCDTVIVEGNYLLRDCAPWRDLVPLWDASVFLDIPTNILEKRLIQRWIDHGFSPKQAQTRAEQNDLPNARQVQEQSLESSHIFRPVI
ncbi:nucleoside/nucleotide kinase family protein [Falsihalocynthiibacter sp. SS001]|uniref:nucleoside/nucleotide kinase family protein n=1 Tax=Falsihalocynthiibacter sp. SS001 TaxID=3349698 RepID=UPI0036D2C8EA